MRRRLLLKGLAPLAALMGMMFSAPADAQQSVPIESARQLRPILQRRIPDAGRRGSLAFARTELYFGTAKSDGTVVTEEEFRAFIDQVITPRFPDGLTVLKGDGQFRLDDDTVIKEQSFVVILLYSTETQKESSRRIEVIRQLYLNLHDSTCTTRNRCCASTIRSSCGCPSEPRITRITRTTLEALSQTQSVFSV